VHTHPDLAEGISLKTTSDLNGASNRLFRGPQKYESHAVPGGQRNQFTARLRSLELVRSLNQLL
jgi:hypothetical protein